jgi:hypothetical protein
MSLKFLSTWQQSGDFFKDQKSIESFLTVALGILFLKISVGFYKDSRRICKKKTAKRKLQLQVCAMLLHQKRNIELNILINEP